jgi:hypothetical protein
LNEILKCKNDIEGLNDLIERNDKGMQEYFSSQLKNVWTLMGGLKARVEGLE